MVDVRGVQAGRSDQSESTHALLRPEVAPLLRQSLTAFLTLAAAFVSFYSPWLIVTDAAALWAGVGVVMTGLLFAEVIRRRPALLRFELAIPAADFLGVGLLRFGTGDSRSIFLPIVILAVLWIASEPGRRHIVYPLLGTCVTLLLPFVLHPTDRPLSELSRLAFVLVIFGTVAFAVNELSRLANLRLSRSQEKRRLVQQELDQAAAVQQSLLPPDAKGLPESLSVFGDCVPARTVGGDFFDWYVTRDGMALTVGDVMGKGVGAGMIAAAVRSVIRSAVDEPDPATALERAAIGLSTSTSVADTQFTTCFHARIDRNGIIRWVDAGHGLAVIRRADGRVERLRSSNLPIGIGTDTEWTSFETAALPGDTLVCVSDGVLDLYHDEFDAVDLFEKMISDTADAAAIVGTISAMARDDDHPDDVTVVAATFVGEAELRVDHADPLLRPVSTAD